VRRLLVGVLGETGDGVAVAWVKVDDHFSDHPKAIGLDLAASGLWLHALCYANRHTTDGFVPAGLLRRLGDPAAADAADRLVEAGLWEPADGGWVIHDYLRYQRSRAEIEDIGDKRAEAGRRGGQAKPKQTGSKPEANDRHTGSNAEAVASKPEAEEEREREVDDEHTPRARGSGAGRPNDRPRVRAVPKPAAEEAPLPADWAPDDPALAWAAAKGWPPDWVADQTELFVGYWTREKPRERKRDWYQAWQRWLSAEAQKRRPQGRGSPTGRPPAPIPTTETDWLGA
jgi:hypothetical protein